MTFIYILKKNFGENKERLKIIIHATCFQIPVCIPISYCHEINYSLDCKVCPMHTPKLTGMLETCKQYIS